MTKTEVKKDRIDRGLALWRSRWGEIHRLSDGRWSVPSGDGQSTYLVNLAARSCTCRDKQFNVRVGDLCKHGWAAVLEAAS